MGKILVCGAKGQLGKSLQAILKNEEDYIYTDKEELDIADKTAIKEFVTSNSIEVIVNCVAYTAVDNAEDDFENANRLNNIAVKYLAEICTEHNIFLIHISTDYIFDGNAQQPYLESDMPHPQTVYDKTKLAGEKTIQAICSSYLILRTAWLYSEFGSNLAKTILRLSNEKPMLKVVNDQIGTPTYATDLAKFIVQYIEKQWYKDRWGIYHFSNEGICSWYDFATELVKFLQNNCEINPCLSTEYPTKAKRPHYSVLDKTKLQKDFNFKIPNWKESVKLFYKKYTTS